MTKTVVVSVGGSLIVPGEIDLLFLRKLKALVRRYTKNGWRFVIIAGGGKTARRYQYAADVLTPLTRDDIDWIGIHATRLNAQLLRAVFVKEAHPVIFKDPHLKILAKEKVLVAAGWKPGASTDYCAVLMAHNVGAKKIVNLSDIDYVYTKDPKKFKNAKPIKEISWTNFRNLIPKKWDPGIHTPFDPIASKVAEKYHLEVAMINGKKLTELENYLSEKPFRGTVIR